MFEDNKHVTAAMPDGNSGIVEIWTTKRDALTEKSVKATLETKKGFKFVELKRTTTAKPLPTKKGKKAEGKKAKVKTVER